MLEELRNRLYCRAKENKEVKFNTLHDKIYRMDVLKESWKQVSENRGSEGIDGETIEEIKANGVEEFLEQIQRELKTGTYKAECVKRVFIPKGNGKLRPLGIPTVKDRVVQCAVKIVIEPIFEADFKEFSYGYRPNRSAKMASLEIYKWLNYGLTNIIDIDIEGFFDHLDHELLLSFVKERVTDGYVLSLIRQWLKAGVVYLDSKAIPVEGTPQGGVISPLLANIYLDKFDTSWMKMGMNRRSGYNAQMVRYADDIIILTDREPSKIKEILQSELGKLKLNLSAEKSRITIAKEGFDFLGFHFMRRFSKRRGKEITLFSPSGRSISKYRGKVKEITSRKHAHTKDEQTVTRELNTVTIGWTNYFNHSHASKTYSRLQNFVYWKVTQFIRYRHKLRHLSVKPQRLRDYGLIPLNGRIKHSYSVSS